MATFNPGDRVFYYDRYRDTVDFTVIRALDPPTNSDGDVIFPPIDTLIQPLGHPEGRTYRCSSVDLYLYDPDDPVVMRRYARTVKRLEDRHKAVADKYAEVLKRNDSLKEMYADVWNLKYHQFDFYYETTDVEIEALNKAIDDRREALSRLSDEDLQDTLSLVAHHLGELKDDDKDDNGMYYSDELDELERRLEKK